MDSLSTSKQLFELLKEGVDPNGGDIDYSELKYVVYARKSTTGDERQERSIPDQIKDIKDKIVDVEQVDANGNKYRLNVSKHFIKEKCSAKDPGIREDFNKLIQDVKDGKVDGIIAWHPDRLSRNMKEAGEIIDLLDKAYSKTCVSPPQHLRIVPLARCCLEYHLCYPNNTLNISVRVLRGVIVERLKKAFSLVDSNMATV